MDIKDVRYVTAIVRLASFTKAARELFVSQPALSQAVKRLEKELGAPLFLRDRNHVIPTEAALTLVRRGAPIMREFDELRRELTAGGDSGANVLSLGISQFYGHHILSFLFNYLAAEAPALTVKVVEGESHFLEQQIMDGRVDVGIFPAPLYRKELVQVPIYEEDILLAVHKDNGEALRVAGGLKAVAPDEEAAVTAELGRFPFVLLRRGLKLRQLVDGLTHRMGFVPQVVMETENLDTCAAFVESNYGLSFLPGTLAYTQERPAIRYFPLPLAEAKRPLLLVYRGRREAQLPIPLLTRLLRKRFEEPVPRRGGAV